MTTQPEALAAIHAAAFVTPRPWDAAELGGLIAAPGSILCAEPNGFLLGRVVADEAEILTIAVRPDMQGAGIGARLVASFMQNAHERGAMMAFLEVAADNPAARALYAKAGFAQTGRRPHYYTRPNGQSVDALILTCKLA